MLWTWTLARIVEVYPEKDRVIRPVILRTIKGEYKRSVKDGYVKQGF